MVQRRHLRREHRVHVRAEVIGRSFRLAGKWNVKVLTKRVVIERRATFVAAVMAQEQAQDASYLNAFFSTRRRIASVSGSEKADAPR